MSCMLKAAWLRVANNPRQSDLTPSTDTMRVQRAQAHQPLHVAQTTNIIFVQIGGTMRTPSTDTFPTCRKGSAT